MLSLVSFVVISPLIYISRASLRAPRLHSFASDRGNTRIDRTVVDYESAASPRRGVEPG
jgi:hypothetical protein